MTKPLSGRVRKAASVCFRLLGLFLVALAWSCAKPVVPPTPVPPPPVKVERPWFEPLSAEQALSRVAQMHPSTQGFTSWRDLEPGLKANLSYVSSKPAGQVAVDRPGLKLTWGALRLTLEDLLGALPYLDGDPALLARVFTWFPAQPEETLVTGYYEPFLEASLEPDPAYPYPVYGRPPDMLTADLGEFHSRWKGQQLHYRLTKNGIKPYHTRGDIDFGGALKGKGLELAWVKDLIDLYFLHIQGSGRLILPDGNVKHILYAHKNGRDLAMLGRTVIRRGHLTRDEASAPRIKSFVQQNPHLAQDLLAEDKSYVFFKLSDVGPFGSMGSLLTPMGSIAVDRSQIPLGAALAMTTPLPVPPQGGPGRLSGLMLAQDTGGAIVGGHVDLFCGSGTYAEFVSGRMKNPGQLFLLVTNRALADLPAPSAANGNGSVKGNGNGTHGNGGKNGNGGKTQ
ncbi:MAG: MltA domain-containing protein [Humidesulfovibrio sp.]|uniref:MltA domain-containing protein n=1 Tax=Humidesulfovibrio sp. TaxID=2910988 RepID=UPI0027FAEA58|nr:MltA domain-containing protein [Humidesulfovibrio sp.]MDQ7835735.1 MltA domain-containing protein [Humidesulfovibrio sp.]